MKKIGIITFHRAYFVYRFPVVAGTLTPCAEQTYGRLADRGRNQGE